MHDILLVTTEFKFRPKYVCSACGAVEYGNVVTAKFHVGMDETPEEAFKSWPLTVRHAPAGWAGYYGTPVDTFRCPKCV